jgi:O-antigen/teichoic acid export membrane protein
MGDAILLLTAAKIWATVLSILVVPLYLRYLGLEAFGIIGFFAALQSAMVVFDLGLSATLTKKLTASHTDDADVRSSRDLMRSAESVYMMVALAVILLLVVLSQVLSSHWSMQDIKSEVNITVVVLLAATALAALWTASAQSAVLGIVVNGDSPYWRNCPDCHSDIKSKLFFCCAAGRCYFADTMVATFGVGPSEITRAST